jgi:hypothetical protein
MRIASLGGSIIVTSLYKSDSSICGVGVVTLSIVLTPSHHHHHHPPRPSVLISSDHLKSIAERGGRMVSGEELGRDSLPASGPYPFTPYK